MPFLPRQHHAGPPQSRHRDTKTPEERKFYSSRRWTELSLRHREREPFCRVCLAQAIYRLGSVSDHIIAIRDGGARWDDDNLQTLCTSCHKVKTDRDLQKKSSDALDQRRFPQNLPRSRIPITIVCGPPGSGKSTYVREHQGPNDLVICLDEIMQKITGLPEHHTAAFALEPALEERNRILRSLEFESRFDLVWFVIALPNPIERQRWAAMLGARIVLMDTPLDECIRRINADPTRKGHMDRMNAAAAAWWRQQC